MNVRHALLTALVVTVAGGLVSGCASVRRHQGYYEDNVLVRSVQPGVDNKDSVQSTLGRPTFIGQFTPNDWYYVSVETRQQAYRLPHARDEKVLHIHFDSSGNVDRIDHTGLDLALNVHPERAVTPTLGRRRSFFRELFGNIGAVGTGAGAVGQTADNPH